LVEEYLKLDDEFVSDLRARLIGYVYNFGIGEME